MASIRLALATLLSASALASPAFAAHPRKDDPVSIAGDEAAFKRLRAEIAQRNAARGPGQARYANPSPGACRIFPVMTDAEIDRCRRAKR